MAPDLLDTECVFDFIYLDAARLAQYLSQLDPNGALTGLKTSQSLSERHDATGRASIAVATASFVEGGTVSEALERTFDASWSLPLSVMDRFDELGYLTREASHCRIGQLLLVSGHIQILDIRLLKDLWPFALKAAANSADGGNRSRKSGTAAQKRVEEEIRTVSEGLKLLPHALQLHVLTTDAVLWATLAPERMVISADDFILKHGSAVPGEWNILAILDSFAPINAVPIWGDLGISQISTAMMQACEQIRTAFGRPEGTIAITPLAIFRKLTPRPDGVSP